MLKMTDEIDDNTNDVILGFFDGDEYIGGADIEPIRYGENCSMNLTTVLMTLTDGHYAAIILTVVLISKTFGLNASVEVTVISPKCSK